MSDKSHDRELLDSFKTVTIPKSNNNTTKPYVLPITIMWQYYLMTCGLSNNHFPNEYF